MRLGETKAQSGELAVLTPAHTRRLVLRASAHANASPHMHARRADTLNTRGNRQECGSGVDGGRRSLVKEMDERKKRHRAGGGGEKHGMVVE